MANTNDYQELQMLDYQLRQFQVVMENVDTQLVEASSSRDALINLKALKGSEEVLFPVANGIFAKGKILQNSSLHVNVGSNIVVEKSVDDAISMMDKQVKDLEDYKSQLTAQMNSMMQRTDELQKKLG